MPVSGIPDWLEPYMREDAYIPSEEDIKKITAQCRAEIFLKYIALNLVPPQPREYGDFSTSDGVPFLTVDDEIFRVLI